MGKLANQLKGIISIVAIITSLFHLYGAIWGAYETFYLRIIHLGLFILLLYVMDLEKSIRAKDKVKQIVNSLWIIVTFATFGYLLINYEYLAVKRFMFVTPLTTVEKILGVLIILLLLEAARRVVGTVLSIVFICFIAYFVTGPYLPGILYHSGFNMDKLLDVLYLTPEGIFGMPLGVSSTVIIMFIIFGSFLKETKFGDLISDFSMGLAGKAKGGPAKVSVLASALMGMISGSSNANVVTTGSVTIPLMIDSGYEPHFAAAVSAAASCGGQIMPPVMGAAVFLMVEYTGISYFTIMRYAIFPSLLYFLAVLTMVHLEANKLGLEGLSADKLPDWKAAVKSKGHLVVSIIVLVILLAKGYGASYAGFYSILSLIAVSLLRKDTRLSIKKFLAALEGGAKGAITVAISCGVAGGIIGIVSLTGIGMRFTSSIISLSGGNVTLALIFAMVAAIILGMGLPTTAAYILMIALVIPALVEMGIELYLAHLFAVYFSCISLITPPVAITSYAAAGIAKSDVMRTGWTAMKLGASAYIVPFMFVYNPELLLVGDFGKICMAVFFSSLGVILLSAGLEGYFIRKSTVIEIILSLIGALLLIKPGLWNNALGTLIIIFIYVLQKHLVKGMPQNKVLSHTK